MSKKIFVTNQIQPEVPADVDYVLNFSNVELGLVNESHFSRKFELKFKEVKEEYLEFLNNFTKTSRFGELDFKNDKFWWFFRFYQKDTWTDSFLLDLSVSLLIQDFISDKDINDFELLNQYKGHLYLDNNRSGIEFFFQIIKSIVRILWMAFRLITFKLKAPVNLRQSAKNAFFTFYPKSTSFKGDKVHDRQFGDVVSKLDNSCFAYACYDYDSNFPLLLKQGASLEKELRWRDIFTALFDRKLLVYFFNAVVEWRKSHLFMGLHIQRQMNGYLAEGLFYYYYYSIRYVGIQRFVEKHSIEKMIITGEFGPDAICLSMACKGTNAKSIWYQHTPFTIDKFWLRVSDKDKDFFPYPDKILVWSEKYREFLKKWGNVSHEKISIVENFMFYNLKIEQLKRGNEKFKCVFLPALIPEEVYLFLQFAAKLIETKVLAIEEVLFKLHPDSLRYYDFESMRSEFSGLEKLEYSYAVMPGQELVQLSRKFVVGSSQLGLELILYDVLFAQYRPSIGMNYSPFYDNENIAHFVDYDNLKSFIVGEEAQNNLCPSDYYMMPNNQLDEIRKILYKL